MSKPTERVREHAESVWVRQKELVFPIQTLRGGGKPSDESREVGLEIPAQYNDCWVDVYDGPLGIGFVVNYQIVNGGVSYVRSQNFGPEVWRNTDWTDEHVVKKVGK